MIRMNIKMAMSRWIPTGLAVLFFLSGCADNNLFNGLADKNSTEAKIEEAQTALDSGNCEKAIRIFTEVFDGDPDSVGNRVNLAAAFVCRAGFNVTELIRVSTDFVVSGRTANDFDLFRTITDAAVELVSETWDEDTRAAIDLLTDASLPPAGSCVPPPFAGDPDAAFDEAVVWAVRAVMAVSSLTDLATGVIDSGEITPEAAAQVGESLRDADRGILCADSLVENGAIADSDIGEFIHELQMGANGIDGDLNDELTVDDLKQYLINQGFNVQ